MERVGCDDCDREYGEEHGFPDTILPQEQWNAISPTGDEGGLLCPCCIIKRLSALGIRSQIAIGGAAVETVRMDEMSLRRRLENIEAALEGRQNRWGAALTNRICQIAAVHQSDGWE